MMSDEKIQGHKSDKIGPLDRVEDEYPSFIIETPESQFA